MEIRVFQPGSLCVFKEDFTACADEKQQQQHEIYFCLGKPIGIYNLNGIHK